jgi:hypothetical protein
MKKLLVCMLFIAFLAQLCPAALTTSIDTRSTYDNAYRWTGHPAKDKILDWAQEMEDLVDGTSTTGVASIVYTPGTEPTSTEGRLYYDSGEDKLKFYNGSAWVAIESGSAGNSLDGAYSIGQAITVDAGSMALTAPNAYDNIAFTVNQQDTGSTVGASITSAGTGALLSFDSNGTGADILGSDSTWNVSKAGLATFAGGLTINTGGELLVTARDVLFDDTYDVAWDTSRDQLIFQDNAVLGIGGAHDAAADVTLLFDATDLVMDAAAADTQWKIGATNNLDILVYGDTATDIVTFDTSAEDVQFNGFDLTLQDNDILNLGDNDDITMTFNGTDLLVEGAAADTIIKIGATNNQDVIIYGDTATDLVTFDTSAELASFNGFDIQLQDDDVLAFGDGKDVIISQSSANLLTVGQTVAGTGSVAFGVNDAGLDLKLFGDTASAYWLWDTSEDTMTVVGGNATITTDDAEADQFKVNATGTIAGYAIVLETTNGGVQINADNADNGDIAIDAADDLVLTAAGVVTVANTGTMTVNGAHTVTGISTSASATVLSGIQDVPAGGTSTALTIASKSVFTVGADAGGDIVTIANGTAGQVIYIVCEDATGETTITPTTFNGGTSITFDALGDAVTLIYTTGTGWSIVGGNSYTIL